MSVFLPPPLKLVELPTVFLKNTKDSRFPGFELYTTAYYIIIFLCKKYLINQIINRILFSYCQIKYKFCNFPNNNRHFASDNHVTSLDHRTHSSTEFVHWLAGQIYFYRAQTFPWKNITIRIRLLKSLLSANQIRACRIEQTVSERTAGIWWVSLFLALQQEIEPRLKMTW